MARMRDVADRAGVSISTVSHVVNGTRHVDAETRRRVRAAMAELGYRRPATAAATHGTQSIGVALSAVSNPYLADLVSAIETSVSRRGSVVLLGETHESATREAHLVETLLARRVDGIVLAPGARAADRTLPMLTDAGVPAVLVDRMLSSTDFDQVGSDNCEPMAVAVDHLVGHGHDRIALVCGLRGLTTTVERQRGYQLGLLRNGRTFRRDLVAPGGSRADFAATAVMRLLDLPEPPTAVITGNNFMTVGVLERLRAEGVRVPEDVAIVGYDDLEWADLMQTPITAIAQDWSGIGTTAVDLLFARIADRDRPPRSVRLPATLRVRRSCGCPAVSDNVVCATA